MFGPRLRLARKRAGLSMRELSDVVTPRISAQTISKFESGKKFPSYSILTGLCKALDVSLDYLLSRRLDAIDTIEYRKHPSASASDCADAEVTLIDRLEHYIAVELILEISPNTDWIGNYSCDYIENKTQIDNLAEALRIHWNLGSHPIPSMCELLEANGIKVIEADLPNSISGLSCRALKNDEIASEVVLISSSTSVEDKRFTLARELALRLIHSTNNPEIELKTALDRFAAAFLVPAQQLQAQTGPNRSYATHYEIILLKHMFGVSATTILTRLGQVGILPVPVETAIATYTSSWHQTELEPMIAGQGFGSLEKPRRFERLVVSGLAEYRFSTVRGALLFGVPLKEFESICTGSTV